MDKGLENLYHKLSDLFHTNASPSSSPNPSSGSEANNLLPISTFFDRIIPSATSPHNSDRRRESTRIARQASIQASNNRFAAHICKTVPMDLIEEQK